MSYLQKIQSNHAFKMLKDLGHRNVDIKSAKTVKLLKKMGFKIEGVRKNARPVSSFVGNEVNSLLEKRASERGISKAALIRDILYNHVGKKNKIL